jgi:hypothetical protein
MLLIRTVIIGIGTCRKYAESGKKQKEIEQFPYEWLRGRKFLAKSVELRGILVKRWPKKRNIFLSANPGQ